MSLLRYIILFLFLCSVPNFALENFGPVFGSALSYLSYILLLFYYLINKKDNLPWPFVLFAITYFLISGIHYLKLDEDATLSFYPDFIKYLIVIICGGQIARNITIREIYIFLLIGASSILVDAAFFASETGRYGGFYRDVNDAGFVCLLGCCLTFALKNKKWKLIGLFYFTFCGVLTFSRTFLLLWILINIIAIIQDKRNVTALALGLGAIILLINISILFQLNTKRLSMVENLLEFKIDDSATNESRQSTWAPYYEEIYESLYIGSGYESFTGKYHVRAGVHNTYLRIIGESGVIPFLLFISLYGYLFLKSLSTFNSSVYKTLLTLALILFFMSSHDFVANNHVTLISLWLYFGYFSNKNLEADSNDLTIQKV